MVGLSKKQQVVYYFIEDYMKNNGYSPSIRDIAEGVSLNSTATVKFHLDNLQKLGALTYSKGKSRSIQLKKQIEVPEISEIPDILDISPLQGNDFSEGEFSEESTEDAFERSLGNFGQQVELAQGQSAENRIPLLGEVAAGAPILAEENVVDYVFFDTNGRSEEYFALKVRGDSMIEAGILSGDFVVVHREERVYHGEIVVALLENEATVKRLHQQDGQIWLMPANKNYEPIDGCGAEILGKVAGLIRQY